MNNLGIGTIEKRYMRRKESQRGYGKGREQSVKR